MELTSEQLRRLLVYWYQPRFEREIDNFMTDTKTRYDLFIRMNGRPTRSTVFHLRIFEEEKLRRIRFYRAAFASHAPTDTTFSLKRDPVL